MPTKINPHEPPYTMWWYLVFVAASVAMYILIFG